MDFTTALELALVPIVLALVVVGGLALRRRRLQRGGGTFDCSLKVGTATTGRGWTLGVARYREDRIEWFRVFSWSFRPKRVLGRRELHVRQRRVPTQIEALTITPGSVIVQCAEGDGVVELAMAEDALTGFLAWLEAAPPGRNPANSRR
jgi:hypothetical protein